MRKISMASEFRGGLESAIQSFSTSIGPIFIFLGLFGLQSMPAALHATLITATIVFLAYFAMGGHGAVPPCSRVASLTAYCTIILQVAHATPDPQATGSFVSLEQLRMGWTVASALYLLASAMVLLSGLLRLGNVFKLIPTPVTSGISNGTALLLVWLAIKQVNQGEPLFSAVVALAMLLIYVHWPKAQIRLPVLRPLPATVMAPLAGIALVALHGHGGASPEPVAQLMTWDWVPAWQWGQLTDPQVLRLAATGMPGAVTLALIMVLETFTAASVMEARFGAVVDANRALIALGSSNMLCAALGGVPSTGSTIRSVGNWLAGGRGFASHLFSGVITTALVLLLGAWLLDLPAPITAGLFLMQALLLADPRVLARFQEMVTRPLVRRDKGSDQAYWLSLCISLVAFFGSLIWASFMGIALSCLLVLRRLSDRLAAKWDYLDRYRSRRIRTPAQDESLGANYHHVAVLRMAGHLFFGNSLRITQLADELHPDADAIIVDVGQVTDLDPSASDALAVLLRTLLARDKTVLISSMQNTGSREMRHMFGNFPKVIQSIDLDRALEFAENQVLSAVAAGRTEAARKTAAENRLLTDLDATQLAAVLAHCERRQVSPGDTLFERDALADGVWLLEEGIVNILIGKGAESSRLATFGPGQFLGEMGFVDGKPRSASAVAETEVRAVLIDLQAFATLRRTHPEAVIKISINIARELSQRVRNTSALLADRASEESSQWSHSSLSTMSRF